MQYINHWACFLSAGFKNESWLTPSLGCNPYRRMRGQGMIFQPLFIPDYPSSLVSVSMKCRCYFHALDAPILSNEALDVCELRRHWSLGIPVIISGVSDTFQGDWSPRYFIERYGNQKV